MEGEFDGMNVRADRHSQGKQERDVFELDDVLEASFLNEEDEDDEEMRCEGVEEGDADVATPSDAHMLTSPLLSDVKATRSGDVTGDRRVEAEAGAGHDRIDLDRDAAAAKNLSRWDVISIGAFRQTQEAQREGVVVGVGERAGHGHTPRSSVDLGKAMKSSPMSMLWRRAGASGGRQRATLPGSIRKSMSGGSNGSGGGGNASASGSNGKHAKRRRLMMSAPTMSSPLVLGGSGSAGSSQPSPNSNSGNNHNNGNNSNSNNNTNSKNRKEARRERKLLKRKHHGLGSVPPPSGASSSHSHSTHHHHQHHHHPPHQYHQHQHHPNAKTRGVSSMQRLGSFGSGVSPLNP